MATYRRQFLIAEGFNDAYRQIEGIESGKAILANAFLNLILHNLNDLHFDCMVAASLHKLFDDIRDQIYCLLEIIDFVSGGLYFELIILKLIRFDFFRQYIIF